MMDLLEVPLADTGLQVHRDDAFGKQIIARTIAAVFVDGRRFDREVRQTGDRVDRNLGPDTGVAAPFPRAVFPGVVAELAGPRNRVEAPDLLAGLHVEGADQPLGVGAVAIAQTLEHRRADDDGVVDDGRGRVQADFALLEIELLVLADDDADLQIKYAGGAERGDRLAGLGVEGDQA